MSTLWQKAKDSFWNIWESIINLYNQKKSVLGTEVTKIGEKWLVLLICKDSKHLCGFSSWYIAWLLFSLRLLAKFEFRARISNKTCLNALKRLCFYIPLNTRKILANSFIFSNFNYCPLVWYFQRQNNLRNRENTGKGSQISARWLCVRLFLTLLKASGLVSMEVRRMRCLRVEIYKTLNDLNPGYMKDVFQVQQSAYSTRRHYNMKVPRVNQTTFSTRSILYEGAKIWNHLPNSRKSAETLEIFTNLMKTWEGPNCNCNFCKHLVSKPQKLPSHWISENQNCSFR